MSNTHYTVNVSMKVPGKLSEVTEYIDFFKELGGAEHLEKTEIQRTLGSSEDRSYSATGITTEISEVAIHGRTVNFKFKIPFTLNADSVFRGYHVTPIDAVAKYFDEFIQYVKKPRPAGVSNSEPEVDAAIIKNTFYDINSESYAGVWEGSCRNKWVKDVTIG